MIELIGVKVLDVIKQIQQAIVYIGRSFIRAFQFARIK